MQSLLRKRINLYIASAWTCCSNWRSLSDMMLMEGRGKCSVWGTLQTLNKERTIMIGRACQLWIKRTLIGHILSACCIGTTSYLGAHIIGRSNSCVWRTIHVETHRSVVSIRWCHVLCIAEKVLSRPESSRLKWFLTCNHVQINSCTVSKYSYLKYFLTACFMPINVNPVPPQPPPHPHTGAG